MQSSSDNTETGDDTIFNEKRHWQRRRVLKRGTISFNKGYSRFSCVVRNLCGQGALLELGETTGIPHQFSFEMEDIAPIHSKIVWRTSNRIGIQFMGL